MKIWGVTEAELRSAVKEAGLVVFNDRDNLVINGVTYSPITKDGRALRIRLSVDATKPRDAEGLLPFQRRGQGGRRLPSVSWEGHREFMRIVFRDHPEARIKSAVADYKGRADFWQKHPSTKGGWPG